MQQNNHIVLTTPIASNTMTKPSTLKAALERHQGRDRPREYKLEKQRKSEKAAEEKRKKKSPQEVKGALTDAALEAGVAAILGGQAIEGEDDLDEDLEGWEDATSEEDSDDEDEGEPQYDLDGLDESDSDSELDNDEEKAEAPTQTKAPKSILKQPSASTKSTSAKTKADSGDDDDDDEEEDIPLSDIDEDADGAEDIIPYQRLTINNTAALTKALTSIALPTASMPFSEHLTLSTPTAVDIPDINDDLNRELALYSQSMSAVQEARRLLKKEDKDFPFSRPSDYFAEMVKDDEQMAKVKSRLIESAASKQASADAKKQRGLKKFGKAVQQQREQERAQDKRKMMDTVKNLKRKRQGEVGGGEHTTEADIFDVSADAPTTDDRQNKRRKGDRGARDGREPNGKRAAKNEKFGRGGKKKHSKENDAKSSGFEAFGAKKKTGASRPGKGRRAAGAARR